MTALLGLSTRLAVARLLLVTDARSAGGDLAAFAAAAFDGGVDIVQLADPGLRPAAELAALEGLRSVALPRRRLVAATSDADLAAEFGADLLVLLDDRSSAARARRRLHRWALVGRSCRTPAAIDAAVADPDVHFLILTADLDAVRHAAAAAPPSDPASKPWFAAGRVTPERLPALTAAGCRRVAVSGAIARAADPRAAASALAEGLRRAWEEDPAMEAVTLAAFRPGGAAGPWRTAPPAPGRPRMDDPDAG